jgi:hypothetical protein
MMFDNNIITNGDKKLHEGPSRRHFVIELTQKRYWMINIGGQLCTRTSMITVNLMMHVKK